MGDIYHFSRAFEATSFVFIPRWENLDADLVAKAALVREETLSSAEAWTLFMNEWMVFWSKKNIYIILFFYKITVYEFTWT